MTNAVHLEDLEGLKRKITIEMPWDEIDTKVNQEVKKLRSQARIDGFRPGKVPEKIIAQRYGAAIRQETMQKMVDQKLREAFMEKSLNVVEVTHIDLEQVESSAPFKFTALFEVLPEIKLKTLEGQALRKRVASVEDKDIDEVLVRLQNQYKEWIPVDRAAAMDDKLVIDFVGYKGGEPFAGGEAKGTELLLGSKQFIPGFEESLVGVKAGEKKTIQVTFPQDYPEASLAGVETTFDVTVHKVLEGKVRALDAAFAEMLGVKEGGVEALRAELKQGLERELAQALRQENRKRVLAKLKELNVFEVPDALIQEEVDRLLRVLQAEAAKHKQKFAPDRNNEFFVAQARDNIVTGLLLREAVSSFNLKVEPEHVRTLLEEKMSAYENPTQMMQLYYNSKELLEHIQSEAMEMLVVDALLNTAKIEEERVSMEEAIRGAQNSAQEHHHHDHDHDHDQCDHEH